MTPLRLRACLIGCVGLAMAAACGSGTETAEPPPAAAVTVKSGPTSSGIVDVLLGRGVVEEPPAPRRRRPDDIHQEAGRTDEWLAAANVVFQSSGQTFDTHKEFVTAYPSGVAVDFDGTIFVGADVTPVPIEELAERLSSVEASDLMISWHQAALRKYVYDVMWTLNDAGRTPSTVLLGRP